MTTATHFQHLAKKIVKKLTSTVPIYYTVNVLIFRGVNPARGIPYMDQC